MASAGIGARAGYSTSSSVATNEPVVSVDWLHSNLREPDLKVTPFCFLPSFVCLYLKTYLFLFCAQVLDASWYMPDEQRNPIQEYQVSFRVNRLFDMLLIP